MTNSAAPLDFEPVGATGRDEPIDEAALIGGPERRDVVIVDPDPEWPERFAAERARIVAALPTAARRIEHIGSTAVAGLAAKPIIDILVTVSNAGDEAGYLSSLEQAGYVLRVREPGHRMFRTPELDVHVHVLADGDPAAEAYLTFRDRLRACPEDRAAYVATKRNLAARQWPTMNHYAKAKTQVILAVLARAGTEPAPR